MRQARTPMCRRAQAGSAPARIGLPARREDHGTAERNVRLLRLLRRPLLQRDDVVRSGRLGRDGLAEGLCHRPLDSRRFGVN